MTHPFCHVELQVRDPARARGFYAAAFGWSFAPAAPDYEWIESGSAVTAGLLHLRAGHAPGVVVFLDSADAGATVAAVRAAGGTVLQEPTEVPGHGRYALVADPEGNQLGVWERQRR